MPKGEPVLLVGVAVLGLVGLLSLYSAWRMAARTRAFQRTAVQACGVVTALKEEVGRNRDKEVTRAFYPVVTFRTREGRSVTFTSDTAVDRYEFPAGEPIQVLYNPADPQRARLDSFDSLGAGPISLGLLGAGFLGGALLVYFLLYREVEVNTPLFVAAGFAVAAGLFLWGAWHLGRESSALRAHGVRTIGTVCNAEAGPLIEYTTGDGRTRQCQSPFASNTPKYAVGDKVPLLYSPARPGRGRIDAFADLWLVSSLCGGLGLVCLLVALYALHLARG